VFDPNQTTAEVTGVTYDGTDAVGSDSITFVGGGS
jgi:hypothetical protein